MGQEDLVPTATGNVVGAPRPRPWGKDSFRNQSGQGAAIEVRIAPKTRRFPFSQASGLAMMILKRTVGATLHRLSARKVVACRLDGVKAKEVNARLADIDTDRLPGMTAAIRRLKRFYCPTTAR